MGELVEYYDKLKALKSEWRVNDSDPVPSTPLVYSDKHQLLDHELRIRELEAELRVVMAYLKTNSAPQSK